MSVEQHQLFSSADLRSAKALLNALAHFGAEQAPKELGTLVRKNLRESRELWRKSDLLEILDSHYRGNPNYGWMREVLKKRPIRSLSGITSLTVLTKPFPCPGRCVFCPVDVRMPKSYIASEPGALRAGRLGFDPYQQVNERLRAYVGNGHPISKIELIVLGGTWSAYPREYQRWFIKRLFDGLNDFGVRHDGQSHAYVENWDDRIVKGGTYNKHIEHSQYVQNAYTETASMEELRAAHVANETADIRCVGLSLETRPDLVDVEECTHLRSLGATKIQVGIQSMEDRILRLNKRGHLVHKTEKAMRLLRQFGFKIHAHWMPNLYGATPDGDINDYDRVFDNLAVRPDELKVYPTALIADTELEQIAADGKWQPYESGELNRVLTHVLTSTPEYSRLTRIIRDIPSNEILAGNKRGNLRQIVEQSIDGPKMRDIRAREIKGEVVSAAELVLDRIDYETTDTNESFVQFITAERKIAGFVRLSLPKSLEHPLPELAGEAVIREVHVYGQAVDVGNSGEAAQHQGLGTRLVEAACTIARGGGFGKVAIISSVGTRRYYERLGFVAGSLYQHKVL